MLKLADLLEALTGTRPTNAEQVVPEAVIDSRLAIPGSLFVALKGERVDGHDFVADAFKRGADLALIDSQVSADLPVVDLRQGLPEAQATWSFPVCLRVEDSLKALQQVAAFWRKRLDLRAIGITGSVGKSTAKELIAEVLTRRHSVLKNPGSLNNEIGLPLTMLRLTPGHRYAVLEMGFYVPGEIEFLCEIAQPQIGVVTNIGTVHAERAGSQEVIAKGKAELVKWLPEDGVAILNYDDPLVRAMAEQTHARVCFYGLSPEADIWAEDVEGLGLDGIRFKLHYRSEALHLRVPMIGRHSVHTALIAAAVGLVEGLSWQDVLEGLRFGHSQLRLMAVRAANGALLLDDTYNASPQSTMAALNLLAELDGHRIAVLGDMLELGPYERQGHEMVGMQVAKVADELVTVGERAHIIAEAARKAGLAEGAIFEVGSSQEAVAYIRERISGEAVVLVKGSRGMRMDDIVPSLEGQR